MKLNGEVISCTRCPRLVLFREEIARKKRRMYLDWDYWGRPVPGFGDPSARLLVLGLAPAAHGANRTGRMFTGDRSADWLLAALHMYGFSNQPSSRSRDDGLVLTDAYITAALRCAPPGNRPTAQELADCRPFLLQELTLLPNLKVILALGRIAFDSYLAAYTHAGHPLPGPRPQFGHGVVHSMAEGPILVGSYHPSQQNTQTRKLTWPMFESVFHTVRQLLTS